MERTLVCLIVISFGTIITTACEDASKLGTGSPVISLEEPEAPQRSFLPACSPEGIVTIPEVVSNNSNTHMSSDAAQECLFKAHDLLSAGKSDEAWKLYNMISLQCPDSELNNCASLHMGEILEKSDSLIEWTKAQSIYKALLAKNNIYTLNGYQGDEHNASRARLRLARMKVYGKMPFNEPEDLSARLRSRLIGFEAHRNEALKEALTYLEDLSDCCLDCPSCKLDAARDCLKLLLSFTAEEFENSLSRVNLQALEVLWDL